MSTSDREVCAESLEEARETGKPYFVGAFDVTVDSEGMMTSYKKVGRYVHSDKKRYFFVEQRQGGEPRFNYQSYVDALSKEAIDEFIGTTYDAFKSALSDEFGKTVPAIFTDEPQVYGFYHLKSGFDKGDASCSITTDFFETYKKKFRRSLEASLPELFFATDSESAKSTRYNYYTHLSERFNEAYMDNIGEWIECEKRFPHGLKAVFDHVRERGMIPGIWVEIEVMGINCPLAKAWPDECFFMRHGKRVKTRGRYQLDFRSKIVRDHATAVVDRLIRDYGIGYFKFDYNQDSGVGTEYNADSVGDGLLEHSRALYGWLCEISRKYPDLIIENCASGGMRIDYKQLSILSIQSTSDQTNYIWNANIASKSATAVLPEQSAVWAYPRGEADENTVVMNMVNALLQRIHLSGKIFDWNEDQMAIVKEGIDCYKTYRHEIPLSVPFYPLGIAKQTDPFFCSAFKTPTCVRMAVWRMDSEDDTVFIPVDTEYKNVRVIFPKKNKATVTRVCGGVNITLKDKRSAIILEIL